jgi:glycosyltransferase involved in cell wall biosynthesis
VAALEPPREGPFFTVIIPTYRRPRMLEQAVESVLAQSFSDFELIVVDDDRDGSAREVMARFADPRLSYLVNDRGRGGAGTRNAGIFRARGRWVAFLDDDDVWLPEKLAAQYRKIAVGDETLVLVYTRYAVYDFDRREVVSVRHARKEGEIARDLLCSNHVGGLFSVAIRAEVLRDVGGLDERFPALQDAELYVRVARRGTVSFVDETLVWVRKDHADRITRNARSKLEGSRLFWRKYRAEISRDPRLVHRAAARVFTFAVASGDLKALLHALPWTLAGVLFDPGNLRSVGARLLKQVTERTARRQADRGTSEPRPLHRGRGGPHGGQ